MQRRERLVLIVLFLASLGLFALADVQILSFSSHGATQARALAGDEPSYLLITHSLAVDRDLNLYNQCINKDSRAFGLEHCGGHAARRDLAGKRVYSIHLPGLPLLLAPSYALALRTGISPRAAASIFMNLLAALLCVQVYLFCRDIAASACSQRIRPLLCTAAVMLTPPVIFYSHLIYPEIPGALLILYAARQILLDPPSPDPGSAPRRTLIQSLATAFALAFLPWLSFRFLPGAVVLLCALVVRKRGMGDSVSALVAFAFSMFLFFAYQYHVFGKLSLSAGYEAQGFASTRAAGANGMVGLFGLLLDQGNGLLPWAPVYALSFTGIVVLTRQRPALGLWICALLAAVYLAAGGFMHWWGGFAPPPRFMVAAAPLLGGPLCLALCSIRRLSFRLMFLITLNLSLIFGYLGCVYPFQLYTHEHILSTPYPGVMCRIFPSFLRIGHATWPLAAFWISLIIGITGIYSRKAGSRASHS